MNLIVSLEDERMDWLRERYKEGRDERFIVALDSLVAALRELDEARGRECRVREALRPFAKDDFCVLLGGNYKGDNSPVFQRKESMLRIGDFKKAKAALISAAPCGHAEEAKRLREVVEWACTHGDFRPSVLNGASTISITYFRNNAAWMDELHRRRRAGQPEGEEKGE